MTVRWTARALNHLREIRDFIARDSVPSAHKVLTGIVLRTRQLGQFPNSGPVVREQDGNSIREVLETPYRILYQLRQDHVLIVGVVHGRRNVTVFLRAIGKQL